MTEDRGGDNVASGVGSIGMAKFCDSVCNDDLLTDDFAPDYVVQISVDSRAIPEGQRWRSGIRCPSTKWCPVPT